MGIRIIIAELVGVILLWVILMLVSKFLGFNNAVLLGIVFIVAAINELGEK